jgi:hypothetical protein
MLVPRTEHDADRPSWECRVCGQSWPCANAKVDLVEQYQRGRTMLILFLCSCMVEAIDDLVRSGGVPADLYDRFLGWVRPAMPLPADAEAGRLPT